MAQEIIDSTDVLNDGREKINDNFTEVYGWTGWAYYSDSLTTPTQTITSTPTRITIDGLGGNSESSYLPLEIRGASELWDSNSINPIGVGDSYVIRLDLEITNTTSNPTRFNLSLDIGSTQNGTGSGGSILITEDSKTLKTGTPQQHTFSFPIFSLSTFNLNKGSLWLSADSGTLTIGKRAITITRISKG